MSSAPAPDEVPARMERRRDGRVFQAQDGTRYALLTGVRLLVNLRVHGDGGIRLGLGECLIDTEATLASFPYQEWHGVLDGGGGAPSLIEWLAPAASGGGGPPAAPPAPPAPGTSGVGRIRVTLYGTPPDDSGAFLESGRFDLVAEFLPSGAPLPRIVLPFPGNAHLPWEQLRLDVNAEVAWLTR